MYYDYNQSLRFTTDGTGALKAAYDYSPYGSPLYSKVRDLTETDPIFGSHEQDEESGQYYAKQRYYDPETGRFNRLDPMQDGLNWYVYCSSDPINHIDPTGLADDDENENENPFLAFGDDDMSFQYDPYNFTWDLSWTSYDSLYWGVNYFSYYSLYYNSPDFVYNYGNDVGYGSNLRSFMEGEYYTNSFDFLFNITDMRLWLILIRDMKFFSISEEYASNSNDFFATGLVNSLTTYYFYKTNPIKLAKVTKNIFENKVTNGPVKISYSIFGGQWSNIGSWNLAGKYLVQNAGKAFLLSAGITLVTDLAFGYLDDGQWSLFDSIELSADLISNGITTGLTLLSTALIIAFAPEITATGIIGISLFFGLGWGAFFEFPRFSDVGTINSNIYNFFEMIYTPEFFASYKKTLEAYAESFSYSTW